MLQSSKKPPKKIIHDGRVWYTVGDAARHPGTTATKVREIMGAGGVEWTQINANRRLLVSAESLVRFKFPGTVIITRTVEKKPK
jgi:hypothetical protein